MGMGAPKGGSHSRGGLAWWRPRVAARLAGRGGMKHPCPAMWKPMWPRAQWSLVHQRRAGVHALHQPGPPTAAFELLEDPQGAAGGEGAKGGQAWGSRQRRGWGLVMGTWRTRGREGLCRVTACRSGVR